MIGQSLRTFQGFAQTASNSLRHVLAVVGLRRKSIKPRTHVFLSFRRACRQHHTPKHKSKPFYGEPTGLRRNNRWQFSSIVSTKQRKRCSTKIIRGLIKHNGRHRSEQDLLCQLQIQVHTWQQSATRKNCNNLIFNFYVFAKVDAMTLRTTIINLLIPKTIGNRKRDCA